MKIRMYIFSVLFLLFGVTPQMHYAQEAVSDSERLIRLEEGQKRLETRIDDLREDMDQRFDDMRSGIDQRFDDMQSGIDQRFEAVDKRFEAIDKRFDDLQFWLQFILGVVVVTLGGMIAQWMVMWKRMSQVEAKVEDRLIIGYREQEFNELKQRLQFLEAKIAAQT